MTENPHFSDYCTLTEATLAFGQLARLNELNVGVQEAKDSLQLPLLGLMDQPKTFRYALKAIYCSTVEDIETFDKIFDWFWGYRKGALKSKTSFKNQSSLKKKAKASLVMMGKGKSEGDGEASSNVSGANEVERLRKTDFSKLEAIDSDFLEELAMKLWQQMSKRLKRKMKATHTNGHIDLRQTIRSSLGQGGDPFDLKMKRRKPRKQRIVVLLDVSGSMDKYSFFLLRFICALRTHFERIDAFIFSTSLICITDYLQSNHLEATLQLLSAKADNWSSGTKIGRCLKDFNEQFGKRILNGQSTVIVLSDGLDTGSPEVLSKELNKIKLRTRQLIWLNPLKGMRGYEPIQRGMSAALPELDVFRSAHNLNSLLELEKFLLHV